MEHLCFKLYIYSSWNNYVLTCTSRACLCGLQGDGADCMFFVEDGEIRIARRQSVGSLLTPAYSRHTQNFTMEGMCMCACACACVRCVWVFLTAVLSGWVLRSCLLCSVCFWSSWLFSTDISQGSAAILLRCGGSIVHSTTNLQLNLWTKTFENWYWFDRVWCSDYVYFRI